MSTPIKISKADKKLIKSKVVAALETVSTITPKTAVSDGTVEAIQSIGQNAIAIHSKLARITKGKKDEATLLLMEQVKNHGKHLAVAFEDGEADNDKVRAYKSMASKNMEELLERVESYIVIDKKPTTAKVGDVVPKKKKEVKASGNIFKLGDMDEDEIEKLMFKDNMRRDARDALNIMNSKKVLEKNSKFLERMPNAENTQKFAASKLPIAPLFKDLFLSSDVLNGLNIQSDSIDGYIILLDQLVIAVNAKWVKENGYNTLDAADRILNIIESKTGTKYGFVSETGVGHNKAKGLVFFWAMPEKKLNKFINMIQKRGSVGLSEWGLAL